MAGRLFGVGVGPGDPELITVKGRRRIEAAAVVAYPVARHGRSVARRAAAPYLGTQVELAMKYPVTTEHTDHPDGYEGALRDFYDESARRIAEHLHAGRDVAVLCEGDPFFYGSYMYLHERLAPRFETEVVAGVTSFSAAAAAAGAPLAKRDDVLTILPGTLPPDVLATRLRSSDAAVVLKLGRTFAGVRSATERAGVAARGIYVERASAPEQRVAPLSDVDGAVPYMSLVLVPTARDRSARAASDECDALAAIGGPTSSSNGQAASPANGHAPSAHGRTASPANGHTPSAHGRTASPANGHTPSAHGRDAAPATGRAGSVAVVGLGPAGPEWLTPEAHAELAAADALVGYATYLARVPARHGQARHASDNRVEAERARHALRLAADGERVAVVSSGDPGIFAMASAVLEAVEEGNGRFAGVEVRVVPGLSAMQAAAARVGAPLGHDFCVVSLSDLLKPWEIVERRLRAASAADLVLALYNPASRMRREPLARAVAVLREDRADSTPVVVARAVGSEAECVTVTTLADLQLEAVDMRTLLIVGSSTTRVVNGAVYTPRRYPG